MCVKWDCRCTEKFIYKVLFSSLQLQTRQWCDIFEIVSETFVAAECALTLKVLDGMRY